MNVNVPVAELQKRSLFIATPMYGGQCFGSFTKSMIDLSRMCMTYGIRTQFSFLFNESLITRARNYQVDEFMRSDFTHMMFIDSDIDFSPNDVLALLALDKDIIGGPYPKKCIAWENVYDAIRYGMVPSNNRGLAAEFAGDFVFNAVPGTDSIKLDEPAEVLEIGTGFMMVKREVYQRFNEAFPQYWYTPDHNRSAAFDGTRKIFQYFQAEIEPTHNRYLSEDYWFCQKARAIGTKIHLVPSMKINHHGTFIYTGSIPAMAAVFAERVKRNDPVPAFVQMDHRQAQKLTPGSIDTTATPITVKQFYTLSAQKRTELFTEWSVWLGASVEDVNAFYKTNRDQWLTESPDTPIADLMRTIKPVEGEPAPTA